MQHFFNLKLTKTNTESAEWAGSGGYQQSFDSRKSSAKIFATFFLAVCNCGEIFNEVL